jgi:NACHT domain
VGDRAVNELGLAQPSADRDRSHLRWTPADYNVLPGDTVEYAARFEDGGPPFTTSLGKFTFDSWLTRTWRDHYGTIVTSCVSFAVLLLYASTFGLMLLLAPARLARVGGADALDSVSAPTGQLAFVWQLARLLFERATLPWLCRHPRVRRAWIAQYLKDEVRFRDLGKPAREDFVAQTEVLDAWVSLHIRRASDALDGFDFYSQRQIYVECPMRIGSGKSGQLIERPGPNTLRGAFARRRAVVAIVGPGGSGKSTLACAIARWAMSNEAETRLLPHRMLPVFIDQDTINLTDAVTRSLREMLGEEELPEDLVRELLSAQRLLVIVDGLSEREPATQELVTRLFGESAVFNTLVITSRSEPRLGAAERTTLFPVLLDAKRVVPFIVDYLARLDRRSFARRPRTVAARRANSGSCRIERRDGADYTITRKAVRGQRCRKDNRRLVAARYANSDS